MSSISPGLYFFQPEGIVLRAFVFHGFCLHSIKRANGLTHGKGSFRNCAGNGEKFLHFFGQCPGEFTVEHRSYCNKSDSRERNHGQLWLYFEEVDRTEEELGQLTKDDIDMKRYNHSDFVDVIVESRKEESSFIRIKKGGFLEEQIAMKFDSNIIIGPSSSNPKQGSPKSCKQSFHYMTDAQPTQTTNQFQLIRFPRRNATNARTVIMRYNRRHERPQGEISEGRNQKRGIVSDEPNKIFARFIESTQRLIQGEVFGSYWDIFHRFLLQLFRLQCC
mmetsp:Transcript_4540/g.9257  ORF Transcript_4540/g.9257 Transcript_4540/m.9257 type:complete len:276 (-) Transcript_4540:741-1568(-)